MKSFSTTSILSVRHCTRWAAVALGSCMLLLSSHAQQGRPGAESASTVDWSGQYGGGVMVKPKYEGSASYDVWPIPYFDLKYKESFYLSPYRGIGYESETEGGLRYGVGIGFDFGRDEEDGDRLTGMGDVDFSGLLRLGVEFDVGAATVGLDLRQAVTGEHSGYELQASLGKSHFIRQWKTLVRVSLNATYGSEDYLQTYFGVTPEQSLRSGNPVYELDSGMREVGVSTLIVHSLSKDWSILFLANYGKFIADVADSPLMEADDRFFGGAFVVRRF
ncbi:MAG: MipA/OmpV family protein [Puniceicoccaceae bacterium]